MAPIRKTKKTKWEQSATEKALLSFFDLYNCKFTTHDFDGGKFRNYSFVFQGGHFVARLFRDTKGVEVIFPCIAEGEMGYYTMVLSLCNRFNRLSLRYKFSYELDDDKKMVTVHMSFFAETVDALTFEDNLQHIFADARAFGEAFDQELGMAKRDNGADLGHAFAADERETFLLRHMEFSSQSAQFQFRPNDVEHLTVGQLVDNLLDRAPLVFTRLQVVTGTLNEITDREAIENFDLSTALIDGTGSQAKFACDSAVVVLHYITPGVAGETERTITFMLRNEGSDGDTLYYRINVLVEPRDTSLRNALDSASDDVMPPTITLLVARDLTSTLKKRQEFDYMWKDAAIKLKEGKESELSETQKFVADVKKPDIAFNMYWGHECMCRERYYEAVLYFKNAYNAMRLNYFAMDKKSKSMFYGLCYFIGFGYCELGLYEKAYYYLDLVGDMGKIDFTSEFINVMANAGDLRVFQFIEDIMGDIKEEYDQDEELPERVQRFVDFMRRRRAFSLITFGELDVAESEFKQMLNEPENRDYAIDELAFIQHKRDSRRAAGGDHVPGKQPEQ